MKVTVLDLKDMNAPGAKSPGNLRAYVTLLIGPLTIYRVKLIKQPGQKAYVSPPQFEYFANGRVNYTPVVKWPEEWKEPIFEAVWTAYEAQRPKQLELLVSTFQGDKNQYSL